MKFMGRISLLFFFSFLLFSGNVFGQYDADVEQFDTLGAQARKVKARKAMKDVKDGVLIIRLSSEDKKILAIDKILSDEYANDEQRSRLERARTGTIKRRDKINRRLYDAFTSEFEYSDVYFMYDTSIYQLNDGVKSGYFLNGELEVDNSINLGDMSYRVGRYGKPFQSYRSGYNFYVMDENFNDLKYFPKFYQPFRLFFFDLTSVNSKAKFETAVSRYSSKLERIHYRLELKGLLPD